MTNFNNIIESEDGLITDLDIHSEWKNILKNYKIMYLGGISGLGKTMQIMFFAKSKYRFYERIDCSNKTNIIELINQFVTQSKKKRVKSILILDNIHSIFDKTIQNNIIENLESICINYPFVDVAIVGRAKAPSWIMKLVPKKRLFVYDSTKLVFNTMMAEVYFKKNISENYHLSKEQILEYTTKLKGLPVAFTILSALINTGHTDINNNISLTQKYVLEYFEESSKNFIIAPLNRAIVLLSLFDTFNITMIKMAYGDEIDENLYKLIDYSSVLEEYANGEYRFNDIISTYFTDKIRQYMSLHEGDKFVCVAKCYEQIGNYEDAMRCYYSSKNLDEFTKFIIKMCERADCSYFTKWCAKYIDIISEETILSSPRLLGVKTLIMSYSLKIDECKYYLKKLYKKAIDEKNSFGFGIANKTLAHTLAALPHQTAIQVFSKIEYTLKWVNEEDLPISNVSPTAAMPSVINGAIDLSKYCRMHEKIYSRISKTLVKVFGYEFSGVADICLGETFYEMNRLEDAVLSLTVGITDACIKGTMRAAYAGRAILSRLYMSVGDYNEALDILNKIYSLCENGDNKYLRNNISCSIMDLKLYLGDRKEALEWRKRYALKGDDSFFITDRLTYMTYAKICIMFGKHMEALGILELLEYYANNYNRNYILIKVYLYKSIICYRMKNFDKMKTNIILAIDKAYVCGFVRILADEGAALMPVYNLVYKDLFKKYTGEKRSFIEKIHEEMTKMSEKYPHYLEEKLIDNVLLTETELVVIRLVAEGKTNADIAKYMDIKEPTVKFHIKNIMNKLCAKNRTMAVGNAKELGIIE